MKGISITNMKIIVATLGGVMASVFGGFDLLLKTVLFLTVLDFLSGILKAVYKRELNSVYMYNGIIKKIGMYMIIALSVALQRAVGNNIPLRDIVIMFYIANESLSILENTGNFVPYPEKLKEVVTQLQNKEG